MLQRLVSLMRGTVRRECLPLPDADSPVAREAVENLNTLVAKGLSVLDDIHSKDQGATEREQSKESEARVKARLLTFPRKKATPQDRRSGVVEQTEKGVVERVMQTESAAANKVKFDCSPLDGIRAHGMGFLQDEVDDALTYMLDPPSDHTQVSNPTQFIKGERHRVEMGWAAPPQAVNYYIAAELQEDGSYSGADFSVLEERCQSAYAAARTNGATDREAALASAEMRTQLRLSIPPQAHHPQPPDLRLASSLLLCALCVHR